MYTDFASVYDRLMADVPYAEWAAFYAGLMKAHGVTDGPVAECACGTGNLTIPLSRFYERITGIDLSGPMLEKAMEKARLQGRLIPFVRQDMRKLALPKKASCVLSTCDGVNYLTRADDVLSFFRAAFASLRPGGALIFDVSTPYKLKTELGTCLRALTDPDICYIWQSSFDDASALFDIRMDIFVLGKTDLYRRLTEEQTQRAHTREELTAWLSSTGFADISFYGDRTQDPPNERELRWHVAAHKPD